MMLIHILVYHQFITTIVFTPKLKHVIRLFSQTWVKIVFIITAAYYGSLGGPHSDFVFICHFSLYVFNFLIFTSPFCFSVEISVFIFYFSVFVFNVLIFTSSFCFWVEISVFIFYFSVSFLTLRFSLRHFAYRLRFGFLFYYFSIFVSNFFIFTDLFRFTFQFLFLLLNYVMKTKT